MSEKRTTTGAVRSRASSPCDDLVKIDLALRGLVGAHHDVARVVDAEVAVAPGLDVVQLERVLDLPGRWRD